MTKKDPSHSSESIPGYMLPPWYSPPQDEINLIDLYKILVRRKLVIFLVTMMNILAATFYAFYAPRIYEAEVVFLPPLPKDVASLQVQGVKGDPGYSIERVYAEFKRNLSSSRLVEQFISENAAQLDINSNLSPQHNLQTFRKKISILDDRKDSSKLRVTLQWEGDANKAAQIANDFVAMAKNITVDQLYSELSYFIDSSAKKLESDIFLKREFAIKNRQDELSRLYEALLTANKLGLSDASQAFPVEKTNINILNNSPLFLSGAKALQLQIATLENRKSDDPFIPGLRELESQLAILKSVSLNKHSIDVARIDQPAYEPESPIKPKRKLIVVMGFVLGLMMGIFAAFIANFWSSNREKFQDALN